MEDRLTNAKKKENNRTDFGLRQGIRPKELHLHVDPDFTMPLTIKLFSAHKTTDAEEVRV